MDAGDVKLGQVFSNDHVNEIPLFQRPYVWDQTENWAPLWRDVVAAARDVETESESGSGVLSDSTYFLGAVVIHQRPMRAKRLDASHIIDGQQRMTTLQVLIAALRAVAASRNDNTANKFKALTENSADVVDEEFPQDKYKVWPLPQDRDSYFWAVREPGDDSPPPDADHRLIRARQWFEEQITTWLDEPAASPSRLQYMHGALVHKVQIVKITLGSSDHPQVIFEALNHRGVRLAAADLVKNRLFYAVEEQGDGALAESLLLNSWLVLDSKEWRREVTTGRIKRALVDLLFSYWLSVKIEDEVVVDSLFSEFSRWLEGTEEAAADIIREMRAYADVYALLMEEPVTTATGRLVATMRATNTNTPWPVLLALHSKSGVPLDQLELAASSSDSYMMRRGVADLTPKDYNRIFVGVLKMVIKADPSSAGTAVATSLGAHTAESRLWPSNEEFKEALERPGLYDRMYRARLRSMLVAIENHLSSPMDVGGSLRDPNDANLNIEHVMPQKWAEFWPLAPGATDVEVEHRESSIHRLGNLTLATTKLNPSMSNKAWAEKRPILQDKSLVKLTTGSILASPDLAKMDDDTWRESWDEARITARTSYLAKLAQEIWPGPPVISENAQAE